MSVSTSSIPNPACAHRRADNASSALPRNKMSSSGGRLEKWPQLVRHVAAGCNKCGQFLVALRSLDQFDIAELGEAGAQVLGYLDRSEERRVGKECRL